MSVSASPQRAIRLHRDQPVRDRMREDVLHGLRLPHKRLPSKYFYDARGSELFELICEQPEYYLTRVELAILREHVGEIAEAIGPHALLMEYGSGSGLKTRLLLKHMDAPAVYMPVEIARAALLESVGALAGEFPGLEMLPVCADFTEPLALPPPQRHVRRTVAFFPGSTIGNFDHDEAVGLLRQMRARIGRDGAALVGVDLKKHPAELEAAYNDAAGVTAGFTLNLLARCNRELGADFDLDAFRHRARWNALAGRIETHVLSMRRQSVRIGGEAFRFDVGEAMLVEYSCKYSPREFAQLAARAGLRAARMWTDPEARFGLQWLEVDAPN
ncbi:MAG TPA: L-histidine N(alpha)-methyltransferase [Rhodanobacteraceae bacterium]|jgi:dimethylhistidine N-methyltransferase|nr:L-histidine N(alpha)-methyltransferase [Rhodanobacteraceae bacterium]